MSAPLVAVIDQGSTATKGAVFRLDGEPIEQISLPVERRSEGAHVLHDAEGLANGVVQILRDLLARHQVTAFGLACQRSTCLLWRRSDAHPLGPALSWQDRSQAARVEALVDHSGLVEHRTGLHLSPYYAAPKLAALLEETPDAADLAAGDNLVAGTLDAFLVHRLVGRPATEPGTAGRTLLYSLEDDCWDAELCRLFGIAPELLPELRTSVGTWGEFEGVPLLAVAGDQQAALIGHGGWDLGTTAAHFGTGAFVLASTGDSILRREGLLTAVLASTPEERRFQLEGPVNSAGSAVDWARSLTGADLTDWRERPLDDERSDGRGPWVLPSFVGTGAPWWRPHALGVVAGLDLETTPDDLFAGVLRGVAHRVLDCAEAIADTMREADLQTEVLRVSGKLTRLRGLTQMLADAGQFPVEVSPQEETGSAGLVRLLGSRLEAGAAAPPGSRLRIEPRWTPARARSVRQQWHDFLQHELPAP